MEKEKSGSLGLRNLRLKYSSKSKTHPVYLIGTDRVFFLLQLLTDRHFLVASDLAVRTHSLATKSPVYFYLSEYVPEDRIEISGAPGASHGVDSKLLFKFRINPDRLKPKDEKMMRLFTEFIEEYARTGIPKIGNVTWVPITPNQQKLNVLSIKSPDNIKMIKLDELAPRRIWDRLPIKENNHLF